MIRKIIHIDMDAFFASIEQRDNSTLKGKPLAVGYQGERGVVAAASYEARAFGVRSAMSSKMALRKCPHLIFTPVRMEVYKSVSRQIMDIFEEYTYMVEPLSLDEAFLDVTENHFQISSATKIAKEIKQKIRERTGLTASAGVSYNKFLAKIASDKNKPDGLFVIKPKEGASFVESLPVEQFFGVGKVTARIMHQMGVYYGRDLKKLSEHTLYKTFGKAGKALYHYVRGYDHRMVEPNRKRKSVGAEKTFDQDVDNTFTILQEKLLEIAQELYIRIDKRQFQGRTLTMKIKYADFSIQTRSHTHTTPIVALGDIMEISQTLLKENLQDKKIRLIGLSVKNNTQKTNSLEATQLRINFPSDENQEYFYRKIE